MKIVINNGFGGYSLSKEALDFLGVDSSISKNPFTGALFSDENLYSNKFYLDKDRSNPKLVECVEKLRSKANGDTANLIVVQGMPGFKLFEYDGWECIYYEYDHCFHCTSANIQGSRFCSQCGAPLGVLGNG